MATKTCGTCNGSGEIEIRTLKRGSDDPGDAEIVRRETCPRCGGSGEVPA